MGDTSTDLDDVDPDAYVSVELTLNSTLVNIKRKRLILKNSS